MSKDYYKILDVSKSATKEEIKKAYRKMAHKYHPDKKDGDEAKFKEANEAYTILSDDQKRSQYDQFGSNFQGSGASGGQGFGGFDFSQFTQGGGDIDLNDILGSFFNGGGGGFRRKRKGRDIAVDLEIEFKDSILGVTKKITVSRQQGGKEDLNINVPPGIDAGEMMRYQGKGEPVEDGISGDLYIKIHVKKHPSLRKEGVHIVTEQSVKITEALLGTKMDIESVDGKLTIKIPEGVRHGEILRVKGKGVPYTTTNSGDLLVKVDIKTPKKLSKKARKAIEELQSEGL